MKKVCDKNCCFARAPKCAKAICSAESMERSAGTQYNCRVDPRTYLAALSLPQAESAAGRR